VVLDGQVSLRLPGQSGVSIQIDELTGGAVFGCERYPRPAVFWL